MDGDLASTSWQLIETFAVADKSGLDRFLVWIVLPDGDAFWAGAWPDEDDQPTGAFAHTLGWEGWHITHWCSDPQRHWGIEHGQ